MNETDTQKSKGQKLKNIDEMENILDENINIEANESSIISGEEDCNIDGNPKDIVDQNSITSENLNEDNNEEFNVKIPNDDLNISIAAEFSNQIQRLQEQLLHAQADFDNFRKRTIKEKEELRKFASAALIEELLPILDNFELGLKSVADSETLSGFQIIFSQLQMLLSAKGVKEISPENEQFNPLQEEAVAYIHHDEIPQEYVVQTMRKGYSLHDRLLRPATVVVSRGKEINE